MATEFIVSTTCSPLFVIIGLLAISIGTISALDVSTEQRSYLGALNNNHSSTDYASPQINSNSAINFRGILDEPKNERGWPQERAKPSYLVTLQKPQPRQSNPSNRRANRNRNQYEQCRIDYGFDFNKLSLQWGPGFCATSDERCVRVVNDRFTIHGMWPSRLSKWGPENCCFDNTFRKDLLAPMMNDLNTYWFSYFSQNSFGFWSHEWLKHGTCARDVPKLKGEKLYFGSTLDMVKKLAILDTLQKGGIVPTMDKPYTAASIQAVLKSVTGGKIVGINCDKELHQPIPILTGLDFCLNGNLEFVDCQEKKRCTGQVYFPNK